MTSEQDETVLRDVSEKLGGWLRQQRDAHPDVFDRAVDRASATIGASPETIRAIVAESAVPQAVIEARAVRGKGRPVVLDDGTEILIRVDLDNLWLIEEEYGSIQALSDELEALDQEPTEDGKMPRAKLFQPMIRALAVLMPWQHEELRDPKALRRAADPERLGEYLTAAMQSLADALRDEAAPKANGQHPDGRPNPPRKRAPRKAAGSRGGSSTTPAPSSSAGPTSSSGG